MQAPLAFYGTLGPACAQAETLARMLDAGMTGLRLNLSHGTLASSHLWLDAFAHAKARAGRGADLLIDLRGATLRIGALEAPLTLAQGQKVALGRGGIPFPAWGLPELKAGDELVIDDGALRFAVLDCDGRQATCRVLNAGVLCANKAVAVPEGRLSAGPLSPEDLEQLRRADAAGVTGIMLPFARSAEGLIRVRKAMSEAGCGGLTLFAKIEDRIGMEALPGLLPHADMIVIARGDLGMRMPLWELPTCQRRMAEVCRAGQAPFMVVTQLLHSMIDAPRPTRAEVSDIAHAVWEGASALMLTGETAAGAYPAEAMDMLVRTAQAALRG